MNPKSVMSFFDHWLFMPKLLYFFLTMVTSSTHAFLYQYVSTTWHIQPHEFGYTNFVQFTNIFGSYIFARLADRTGAYRPILTSCIFGYCVFRCLLMFPIFDYHSQYTLAMLHYLTINGAAFFFIGGTFPLLDALVMNQLSSNPEYNKEIFGRQRLFATIGHCVVGVLVDWAIKSQYSKSNFENPLTIMFCVLIVTSVTFALLVFWGIPPSAIIETKESESENRFSLSLNSKENLLMNPGFLFFLFTIFVAGIVRSVITNYQSAYITAELHYDKSVVTDSIFIRVFPEVALFFFSKEVTQYLGIYWVLIIGHISGVLRMFGYTLIKGNQEYFTISSDGVQTLSEISPPRSITLYIYFLECLKGVNASFVISSATRIAADMAPKGMSSTAQGYTAAVWQGLSNTVASAICICTVKLIYIRGTMLYTSLVGMICIFAILLKFMLIDRSIVLIKC